MTRRVILVTGTPRSGTTPVGDALAAAPGVRTLYEPLNFHVGDRRVQRYFEVPGAAGFSVAAADELIRDVARPRLQLRPGIFPDDRGLRRAVKHLTGSRTLSTYRLARVDPRATTLVWKDPFAAFLADRVAAGHAIPVVATYRPAPAVAASFKRLGWSFDVVDLAQRLAAAGRPAGFDVAGLDLAVPAINGAVVWRLVNDALLQAARRNPDVVLLDMDAFVADRTGVLAGLCRRLDLTWTPAVDRHLQRSAAAGGPAAPATARAHGGRRDASAVNRYWVDVLTADEARAVERITGETAARLQAVSGHEQPPQR